MQLSKNDNIKLMREGKLPKKQWKDFQWNKEESEDKDMEAVLEERKQK